MSGLKLPIMIKITPLTTFQLLEFKKEEVREYCKRCSNYGSNYSCPSDGRWPEIDYKHYPKIYLISTKVSTQELKEKVERKELEALDSIVARQYIRDHELSDMPLITQISMYAFSEVKDQMTQRLLWLEENMPEAYGMPPGACTRCKVCKCKDGQPCPWPKEVRYSLESCGFLISEIYETFLNESLSWEKGNMPDYFHSISGYFSSKSLDIRELEEFFQGMYIEFS